MDINALVPTMTQHSFPSGQRFLPELPNCATFGRSRSRAIRAPGPFAQLGGSAVGQSAPLSPFLISLGSDVRNSPDSTRFVIGDVQRAIRPFRQSDGTMLGRVGLHDP